MEHQSPYQERFPNPNAVEDEKRVKTAVVTLWIFGVLNLLGGFGLLAVGGKILPELPDDVARIAGAITLLIGIIYGGLAWGMGSGRSVGSAKAAFVLSCVELGLAVVSFNFIGIGINVAKVVLVYRGYRALQTIVSRVDSAEQENPMTAYYHAFIPLLVHVMKADQVIDRRELKALERLCDSVDLSDMERARIFDRAQSTPIPISDLTRRYMAAAEAIGMQRPPEHLLDAICVLASADRVFRESEKHVVRKIGLAVGFSEDEIEARIADAEAQMVVEDRRDALKMLGLDSGFDSAALEAAYRKRLAETNPDHFAHLGSDVVEKVKERRRAVEAAYATLRT